MVFTAIPGVPSAVAIPRFVGARDITDAKAQVSAAIVMAKECQTSIQTRGEDIFSALTYNGSVSGSCDQTNGGTLTASRTKALPAAVTGINCLGTFSAGGESTASSIPINGEGAAIYTLA